MKKLSKGVRGLKAWYEKQSGKEITDEEAKEMADNLVRFFEILARWDAEEKSKTSSKNGEMPR